MPLQVRTSQPSCSGRAGVDTEHIKPGCKVVPCHTTACFGERRAARNTRATFSSERGALSVFSQRQCHVMRARSLTNRVDTCGIAALPLRSCLPGRRAFKEYPRINTPCRASADQTIQSEESTSSSLPLDPDLLKGYAITIICLSEPTPIKALPLAY